MPEAEVVAESVAPLKRPAKSQPFTAKLSKRWRAWLRSVHRDIGYLAVGFTVIYALSGIANRVAKDMNPIDSHQGRGETKRRQAAVLLKRTLK